MHNVWLNGRGVCVQRTNRQADDYKVKECILSLIGHAVYLLLCAFIVTTV